MKYDTQMRLAANLKQLRLINGFSQNQLAAELKIDRSVLALYESGRRCPDPETLCAIARLYGMPMEILLDADPAKIACEAESWQCCEKGERELIRLYRGLSPFSRGRLLEKADDLKAWDATFARMKAEGKRKLPR